MHILNEIRQNAVKIEYGDIVGSGILYVLKESDKAYILTVAHIFSTLKSNLIVKVYFEGYGKEIEYKAPDFTKSDVKRDYKIKFLDGYVPNREDSSNDGAVIEIPKESWMNQSKYQFNRANMKEKLLGIGYPRTGGDKYADFECWVLESPIINGTEEKKDCRVRYNQEKYKESMSIGTEYLDGYSGMGLFFYAEREQELYCSAIFCRDAGTAGILYATDAVRLYELIESMVRGYSIVYPKAKYIEYNDLQKRDVTSVEDDLNVVLEKIYHNPNDFFRCLCGYTGVGKTYTVNLVSHYSSRYEFEYSWTKLMSCLNARNLKELQDTVYILDPLEQTLSREEREQLLYQKESDRNIARLNTMEKTILIKKIEEHSNDLKKYNIHILFIGHKFFWKDVEEQLIKEGSFRLCQKLKNSIIYCSGFDKTKIKKILEEQDIKCPEYFYDIPLFKRPLWLIYVIENKEKLPRDNEEQYEYEFRLYDETLEWFEKIGNVSGDFEYLETFELDELEKGLQDYLIENIRHRGNKKQEWDSDKYSLICAYPFKETNKGFQLNDPILHAYLIAKILYDYACDNNQEKFVLCLMDAQEMARINSYLLKRIPVFIRLFLLKCRTGVASDVEKWLREEYKECYEWLYDNDMVLLIKHDRDVEKNYIYNTKDDKFLVYDRTQEDVQKFSMDEELQEDKKRADKRNFTRNNNWYL